MAPAHQPRIELLEALAAHRRTVEVACMNQATWRHCHFGPKSAPRHRDFGPIKVEVI